MGKWIVAQLNVIAVTGICTQGFTYSALLPTELTPYPYETNDKVTETNVKVISWLSMVDLFQGHQDLHDSKYIVHE